MNTIINLLKSKDLFLSVVICVFVSSIILLSYNPKECEKQAENVQYDEVTDVDTLELLNYFSKEEFCEEYAIHAMELLNIEHKEVVHAQMVLESGHFNSNLANKNNNYFGMKHPTIRKTTSIGKRDGFANYSNWLDSIIDYKLWQERYASGLTKEQYLSKLGNIYASDVNYVYKLKNIMK